nr:zinc finger, CCHC-type [Tanacetum cinerariifolium]
MPGHERKVCKLKKSLYGLKQAPKQWHQKFDDVVLSNDFSLNQADKCVYSKFDASGKGVIVCLYVDDMLIFGTDQDQVNKTKEFLSSKFDMKDLGETEVILGIRIKRGNNSISISQSHYIEKILTKFNFANCFPVYTLVDPTVKFRHNKGTPESLVGTLATLVLYIAAAGNEAEWLRNLVQEIPLWPKPISTISIRCDSAATLAKAYSQVYNAAPAVYLVWRWRISRWWKMFQLDRRTTVAGT